jgi:hypothetical protein
MTIIKSPKITGALGSLVQIPDLKQFGFFMEPSIQVSSQEGSKIEIIVESESIEDTIDPFFNAAQWDSLDAE